jgi:hypothetical protein
MKIVELILDENQEESGIEAISIVESPAIEEDFIALKSNEIKLAEIDKEKKILMGALLIPNKPIYRNNGEDEYYIYFSKDTVLKASQMYLTKGNQNNSTLEHQHSLSGLSLVESWLVEDEVHDKSRKYGMNVPVGTWMGAVKVNNDEVWNDYVKTGKVKGFSIEGYFADKMERPKESIKEDMSEKQADLLLNKIKKIVKGEKVELAESVIQLLKYHKGVEIFSENINIDIKEIDSAKNSLEVDLKDLMSDMEKLAKGINSADTAAKLLGMSVSEIPNYNKAIQAAKLGFKQEAKAKKYLK